MKGFTWFIPTFSWPPSAVGTTVDELLEGHSLWPVIDFDGDFFFLESESKTPVDIFNHQPAKRKKESRLMSIYNLWFTWQHLGTCWSERDKDANAYYGREEQTGLAHFWLLDNKEKLNPFEKNKQTKKNKTISLPLIEEAPVDSPLIWEQFA